MQIPLRIAAIAALLPAPALAQAPLYDLSGTTGELFGTSVASIGDVDGDGFPEFAVGAIGADGLQPDAGRVTIHSGRTTAALVTMLGERTDDQFGFCVAALGDVDGDGVNDLVGGAPLHEWTAG